MGSSALLPGLMAIAVAGCASTAPVPDKPCAIVVHFQSVCCGPDVATLNTVLDYLRSERGIVRMTSARAGIEGESDHCVVTRSAADTDRIFAGVAARIPPTRSMNGGPTRAETADGRATPLQQEARR